MCGDERVLVVGHGLRGPPVELERVRQVQPEDGHAVEHRQPEQGHARAGREHVRIFTSGSKIANKILFSRELTFMRSMFIKYKVAIYNVNTVQTRIFKYEISVTTT